MSRSSCSGCEQFNAGAFGSGWCRRRDRSTFGESRGCAAWCASSRPLRVLTWTRKGWAIAE